MFAALADTRNHLYLVADVTSGGAERDAGSEHQPVGGAGQNCRRPELVGSVSIDAANGEFRTPDLPLYTLR
jgi:hypothetical protein